MSSLVPGSLFETSGLNRLYTPTEFGLTSGEISRKFAREPFNGHPWPRSSPSPRVYDIANTSTKLILLNNKKSQKYSHLRGHSAFEADRLPVPDPERHFAGPVSPVNKDLHIECKNSQSPRFVPTPTGLEWCNQTQRPPSTFSNISSKNPRYHHSCTGPTDITNYNFNTMMSSPNTTKRLRMRRGPPQSYLQLNLDDSGLTAGQRSYLWSIARIYSSDNMRRQKQQQYFELLRGEIRKGGHRSELCYHYARYLESPRKTQCGKDERLQRSKSAPPRQTHRQSPRSNVNKGQHTNFSTSHDRKSKSGNLRSQTKSSQPGQLEESSDVSSSQSGSSLTIDMCGYAPREGTLRPKSRIGRRDNQSGRKPPSESQQEPVPEEETPAPSPGKITNKNSQVEQKSLPENRSKSVKTVGSSDSRETVETQQKLKSAERGENYKSASDNSSSGSNKNVPESGEKNKPEKSSNGNQDNSSISSKSNSSSVSLPAKSGNHNNRNVVSSHGSKASIKSTSSGTSKDMGNESSNSANNGQTVVNRGSTRKIASSTSNGSVKSRKYSTGSGVSRTSVEANGKGGKLSSGSRKSSEGSLNRTLTSAPATSHSHRNTNNISEQNHLEEDSRNGSDKPSPNVNGDSKVKFSDDGNGMNQASTKTAERENGVDLRPSAVEKVNMVNSEQSPPQADKGLTGSPDNLSQQPDLPVVKPTLTENCLPSKTPDEKPEDDTESHDNALGRVSPLPSIGSDDLEPVDPDQLEY